MSPEEICRGCECLRNSIEYRQQLRSLCHAEPAKEHKLFCPCYKCLVKPTCTYACDKYYKYAKQDTT